MSVIPEELHSDAESMDRFRPQCWVQRFHKNQYGTTLTEFLITLPIFIVIFITMVRLGQFELTAGQVWKTAYQDTWAKALPVSESPVVPISSQYMHGNPQLAGSAASAQLGQHSTHNKIDSLKGNIGGLERDTYSGLQSSGHWGESFNRIQPIMEYADIVNIHGYVSAQPTKVIGNSGYSRSIVDDSGGMVQTANGGSGVAAAVAAGARYGTVFGMSEINPTIMGIKIPMYVHFNTLVAPMPFTESTTTMEVSRSLMLKQSHYRDILGISMSQPLSSGTGSLSVPDMPKGQ